MNILKTMAAVLTASSAVVATSLPAHAIDEITVGYILSWPTPNQFAQANKMYEKELGVKVNWLSFDAGPAMSAAMASGDVQISFSQGVTPFLVAIAADQDLQIVDVAVSYSNNDNCVVHSKQNITKDNVADLKGKKVAVPIGSAAYSGFLAQMKHFGIEETDLTIVNMAPSDSAAAFSQPSTDIAMACGWGGALRKMKEHGKPLLDGKEKEAVVGKIFDITSIPTAFGEQNPELMAKFLKVTADMNKQYAINPESMLESIAKEAGIDMEATKAILDTFVFLPFEVQLSKEWMGGGVAQYLNNTAKSLKESGKFNAIKDYNVLVNSSYLEAASKM